MGLKHKLFGIVLLWPVLQGYAQEIKIGNYTFKDGAEYQGELFKGKPYGKGITHFKNGDSYEGEYVKGKRQGYGVYKFPDGEKYEGEWFQDQQHGHGIYYFMNNNKYEGLWFRDFQQGQGTMYYYNGDVYKGNWEADKREGYGEYKYANGAFYRGEWSNDQKNGKGIFPASAQFSAELHSLGQYIQQGDKSLFETAIYFEQSRCSFDIPRDASDLDGLNYLAGRDLKFLQRQSALASLLAHADGGVPNMLLSAERVDEACIGELIYFFMVACAVSAYAQELNPFDQPGVEEYKRNTFALLGRPGYEDLRHSIETRLKQNR